MTTDNSKPNTGIALFEETSIGVVCVDSPCLGSLTTLTSRRARMLMSLRQKVAHEDVAVFIANK